VAKTRLNKLRETQRHFTAEQILNELLRTVTIPTELEEPQYLEFERLFKLGRVPLPEFLHRFQHLGSLDINQPRLGEYSLEKLFTLFGPDNADGFEGEITHTDDLTTVIDLEELGIENGDEFYSLYTYGGQFMHLRERAKSELLKLLWILKRMFVEFARPHRFGDLIFYLELDQALALGLENRKKLRMHALQRKAYFGACQLHRVKNVLSDLQSSPFERKPFIKNQEGENLYRFARGKTIFYGQAEGLCLTASSNEEFFEKLAVFRTKNIGNIIGIFKGIEPSYFNMSALAGFTTENGGYLSHAATIARELRLPYITDIGFDQFQDEDYLILDTENDQVIVRR
jgi:phosphohistidine swiveling domain-containing protein